MGWLKGRKILVLQPNEVLFIKFKRIIVHYRFGFLYTVLCLIISTPFNLAVFNTLFPEDGIPAGADSANHAFFIKNIIETHNPLIQYSQFSGLSEENTGYYPSFFHVIVGIFAAVLGYYVDISISIITVMTSILFIGAIIGSVGYAFAIRKIIQRSIESKDIYLRIQSNPKFHYCFTLISALAFGFLIYSSSPIVKLYNDGTYGEVFAMWIIFPYLIYFLLSNKWIISAILLATIAYTHNLSFVMSLIATISYLLSLLISNDISRFKKGLRNYLLLAAILCIPAVMAFYLPTFSLFINNDVSGAVSQLWSKEQVISQLLPLLYYAGAVSTVILLFINYKFFSWFSMWVVAYFTVFNFSYWIGARFGRELSVLYGLIIGVCVANVILLVASRLLTESKHNRHFSSTLLNSKFMLACLVAFIALVLPLYYSYHSDRFQNDSNPLLAKYYTASFGEANNYISENIVGNILVLGHNPWLKFMVYDKINVFESVAPDIEVFLNSRDRIINSELNRILYDPNSDEAKCVVKNYEINAIFVADKLPGRWYTEGQESTYYNDLKLFQKFNASNYMKLSKEFHDGPVDLRVYETNPKLVSLDCIASAGTNP
jgi:hypothetical protein